MNKILYFAIGVFLAFCLFWPVSSFAAWQSVLTRTSVYSCEMRQSNATLSQPWQGNGATFTIRGLTAPGAETYLASSSYTSSSVYMYHSSLSGTTCTAYRMSVTEYQSTLQCSDGIQNFNETGVDCGGSCAACPPSEPAHCSNNTWDVGDEEGIDCGSPCLAECTEYCPTNTTYWGNAANGSMECWDVQPADQFGNCPAGFSSFNVQSCPGGSCPSGVTVGKKACYEKHGSVLASSLVQVPDAELSPGWNSGNFSVVDATNVSDPVDNGDGTHTITETKTTTGPGGSSSTTTTNNTYNTTTGQLVGSTSTTTGETSPEENPGNYNLSVSDSTSDGDIPIGILPEENTFSGFLDSTIGNNAASSIIESSGLETSSGSCSISGQIMGQTLTISFCDPLYSNALEALGALLVSFCYLLAIFLIFL